MRQTSITIGLVTASALVIGCTETPAAPTSHEAPQSVSRARTDLLPACTHVSGSFVFAVFQFTSATRAIGDGTITGDLAGTFAAVYNLVPAPGNTNDGLLRFDATHTITTVGGTVTTHDDILLRTDADGITRPHSEITVVGGTGAYAGATGLLHGAGALNLSTQPPGGSIGFQGQLCVPQQ